MRLSEFTDSTTCTSTDTDATDCLRQIERLRIHNVEDDDVPFLVHPKKQRPQNDRAKTLRRTLNAERIVSIRDHVGGTRG